MPQRVQVQSVWTRNKKDSTAKRQSIVIIAFGLVLLMVIVRPCRSLSTFASRPYFFVGRNNVVGKGAQNAFTVTGTGKMLPTGGGCMNTIVPKSSFWLARLSSAPTSTAEDALSLREWSQESHFLHEVNKSVEKVLDKRSPSSDILDEPPSKRESIGVANRLRVRLEALKRSDDCPRCWLQRAHCVCGRCPPLEEEIEARRVVQHELSSSEDYNYHSPHSALPGVRRLFLLMHHKEIGLVVDTAKMILRAFPNTGRLVVAGIGEDYQPSMAEMMDAINGKGRKCIVLFPADGAKTFRELKQVESLGNSTGNQLEDEQENEWDVIVIDGTWAQARKMHGKYIPSEEEGGPPRVQLSDEALEILGGAGNDNTKEGDKTPGLQLRRHPIKWREISTLEATRLLLRDIAQEMDGTMMQQNSLKPWEALADYQRIADNAAKKQLGPHRERQK